MATESFPYTGMIIKHATDPQYHQTAKYIWDTALTTELPWFSLAYIIGIPLLRLAGVEKLYQPYKSTWKKVMWSYNILMSLFSLACFVLSTYAARRHQLISDDCDTLFRDELFVKVGHLFYLSKYVEYADTFFLILRGEPVSYLQWFHHIGAAWSMWMLLHFHSEPGWVFVNFNSFIHTIMYYYYACAVTGKKIKWLPKQAVTSMQIVQFVAGFCMLDRYIRLNCYYNDPVRMLTSFYFSWFYVGGVLLLFLNFFLKNYVFGGSKPKKAVGVNGSKENGNEHGNGNGNGNGHGAKAQNGKKHQ